MRLCYSQELYSWDYFLNQCIKCEIILFQTYNLETNFFNFVPNTIAKKKKPNPITFWVKMD